MKINYVLIDDVHCKKREARQPRTQSKNIQVGDSMIGQILPQPPSRPVISDEELKLMREIVKQSGYFERNKTRDVDHRLIREMIR